MSPEQLSVRELKSLLDKRGIYYKDCVEKKDLAKRLKDSMGVATSCFGGSEETDVDGWRTRRSVCTIAGLDSIVIDSGPATEQTALLVVLCHGFGANNLDLADIGQSVCDSFRKERKRVRFVVPNGPLELMPGAPHRAWWNVDMEKYIMALMAGRATELRNQKPDGLQRSSEQICELLLSQHKELNISHAESVLAGFSQGAILATDACFHIGKDTPPAALCAFSGSVQNEQEWRALLKERNWTFPILQSHGTQDSTLPMMVGEWLKEVFQSTRLSLDFVRFDGGHTIPPNVLSRFQQLLHRLIKNRGVV